MRVGDKHVRKGNIWKNRGRGFTLAELLIVVAIIAVLVAISIPIFTSQLHKAKVAADWANLRAYYAEIQTDFITTGEFNPKVTDFHNSSDYYRTEIEFLNGQKIKMQEGFFWVTQDQTKKVGYQIVYECNQYKTSDWEKHEASCELKLGTIG